MRCTQLIGLNERAQKLLDTGLIKYKMKGTRYYEDGRTEDFESGGEEPNTKCEVYEEDEKSVMFPECGERTCLHKHTLPNGTVYKEIVQCAPWASGPCIFLCLVDADGKVVKESLWTEEEIQDAI